MKLNCFMKRDEVLTPKELVDRIAELVKVAPKNTHWAKSLNDCIKTGAIDLVSDEDQRFFRPKKEERYDYSEYGKWFSECPVIYVAGPYIASATCDIDTNIARARELAKQVWKLGIPAICPHSNASHFDGIEADGLTSYELFVKGTLEIMRRCDAVLVLPNWTNSNGTKGEIAEALRLKMPVFADILQIKHWKEGNE